MSIFGFLGGIFGVGKNIHPQIIKYTCSVCGKMFTETINVENGADYKKPELPDGWISFGSGKFLICGKHKVTVDGNILDGIINPYGEEIDKLLDGFKYKQEK